MFSYHYVTTVSQDVMQQTSQLGKQSFHYEVNGRRFLRNMGLFVCRPRGRHVPRLLYYIQN